MSITRHVCIYVSLSGSSLITEPKMRLNQQTSTSLPARLLINLDLISRKKGNTFFLFVPLHAHSLCLRNIYISLKHGIYWTKEGWDCVPQLISMTIIYNPLLFILPTQSIVSLGRVSSYPKVSPCWHSVLVCVILCSRVLICLSVSLPPCPLYPHSSHNSFSLS